MEEKQGFVSKLEGVLMPVANTLANQPHLAAVRDAFITTFPVVLSGTFLLLITALTGTINGFIGEPAWLTGVAGFFGKLSTPAIDATNGIMAIFVAFLIAYNYAHNAGQSGPTAGILSVSGFFLFYTPSFTADHELLGEGIAVMAKANLGATGIFSAMLVGLISASLYVWLNNFEGLKIKMPAQVPPAVAGSFSALIPTILIMLIMSLINFFILKANPLGLMDIIQKVIGAPLMKLGKSPFTILIIILVQSLLWIFGIHGPNTTAAVTATMYAQIGNENTAYAAATAGVPGAAFNAPHKFPFTIVDSFSFYGGSGATLGLLIAIFLFSKREDYKTVAKLSIVPGLFNINEPVIFGLPIVLNPILAIPFMLAPVVCTGIAMLAINFGIIPTPIYAGVWILPGPINAFLTTLDWKAFVLGLLLIVVSTLIYTPFVIASNSVVEEEE